MQCEIKFQKSLRVKNNSSFNFWVMIIALVFFTPVCQSATFAVAACCAAVCSPIIALPAISACIFTCAGTGGAVTPVGPVCAAGWVAPF